MRSGAHPATLSHPCNRKADLFGEEREGKDRAYIRATRNGLVRYIPVGQEGCNGLRRERALDGTEVQAQDLENGKRLNGICRDTVGGDLGVEPAGDAAPYWLRRPR